MRIDDDSDMKIAGEDFSEPEDNADESAEAVAALLEQEKKNGNLSRARRLGAIMADEVSAIEGGDDAASRQSEEHAAMLTQRRILLAFAVEVGLDAFLPNNLVAQTAQNIFYNTLHITAPSFYDDLQESGAFSFYYLCFREGRQVERRVGETFASLCGKKGDQAYARMGEDLYTRFIAQVKHFTDTLEFIQSAQPQGNAAGRCEN